MRGCRRHMAKAIGHMLLMAVLELPCVGKRWLISASVMRCVTGTPSAARRVLIKACVHASVWACADTNKTAR